jgi:hypothetical protein
MRGHRPEYRRRGKPDISPKRCADDFLKSQDDCIFAAGRLIDRESLE